MQKSPSPYLFNKMPESHDFCPVCSLSVPLARRITEVDIHDNEIDIHLECRQTWLIQETKKVIISIAENIKGICAESSRFCKKIKKKLRSNYQELNELKTFFQEIVSWIKGRFEYFRQVAANTLNKLYKQINYLAEKLGIGEEIISFPLPIH
ncbi:MAG: hypothetical protein V3T98_01135 [Candidatus Paceibacterota bacterium]